MVKAFALCWPGLPRRRKKVPVTTLPEERFRFSRIKDDPLRAILQRVGLAFALILLVAVVTYLTRGGFANSPDAATPLTFIDAIGLREHLSPNRSNGLVAMLDQMKRYALAYSSKS